MMTLDRTSESLQSGAWEVSLRDLCRWHGGRREPSAFACSIEANLHGCSAHRATHSEFAPSNAASKTKICSHFIAIRNLNVAQAPINFS